MPTLLGVNLLLSKPLTRAVLYALSKPLGINPSALEGKFSQQRLRGLRGCALRWGVGRVFKLRVQRDS